MLCSNKLNLPADRIWEMTVSDICLTLETPQKDKGEAETVIGQKMMCVEAQRLWEIRQKMTAQDWVELAEWKQRLM